jgi:hypothetical protein
MFANWPKRQNGRKIILENNTIYKKVEIRNKNSAVHELKHDEETHVIISGLPVVTITSDTASINTKNNNNR